MRHHNEVARLELPPTEFARAIECHAQLVAQIQACGYSFVALDLAGFHSGSLNHALPQELRMLNVVALD
ncbi:hypothetical protein D3C87_2179080 [compost metagenome]